MRKILKKLFYFSKSSQTVLTLFAEICIGITAMIGSLFIFLKLADHVLDKETISFDSAIIHFIYLFRGPAATTIMTNISLFGGQLFLSVAIIITILLLIRKYKKDALIFSFILFFGIVLNLLLKDMFQRPRPNFLPLVHETSYSFPSGHAMNSFVFYMSLSYFIFRNTRNKKLGIILTLLSGFLVLSIGISRIYLGVHYPSDVLAGFAAGLLWFVIVLLFEKTLIFLRLFRQYKSKKKY
jgi:undecaprenyl-diphosphatase